MHDQPRNPGRRRLLRTSAGLGALAAASTTGVSFANTAYPTRPITFIVPWPAGSVSDVTMRALCQVAGQTLGQPIVVENRAGVSGMLGVKTLASAAPDGYTIGQVPLSVTRFTQLGTIDVDVAKDLDYIARASGLAFGIVVRADSPWQTLDDLVQAARGKPDHFTYASPGMGNQTHIGMELFSRAAGIQMMHVPFKGGNEATQALMGGHVDAAADSATWAPLVLDGRLRLLATWGNERLARFPDVPTLKEQGYDIVMNAPGGIAGPHGLPPEVLEKLRVAFREAIQSDAHKNALAKYDMTVEYLDSDDYRAFILQSYQDETKVIQDLNLKELLS